MPLFLGLCEGEGVVVGVDGDGVALGEVAGKEAFGEGVFESLLDGAFEGAGAEGGVVAFVHEQVLGTVGDADGEVVVGESFGDVTELDVDDLTELVLAEGFEDDGFVDAVEELGPEDGFEGFVDVGVDFPVGAFVGSELLDLVGGDVAGHDDDGVFEVDGSAVAVGESAVVEDLEQDVEDVGVSFFDFVEQDDAVGASSDGFGESASFFVADVAGRGADHAGDAVWFHEFAHVESYHRVFVVEEEFGECFAEFGFADAGGAQEDEGADGSLGVAQACAAAADGVADGGDGFVLAYESLFDFVFHVEQFFSFAGEQA